MRNRRTAAMWAILLAGILWNEIAQASVLPITAATWADFPAPGESTPTTGWYLTGLTSGAAVSDSLVDSEVTSDISAYNGVLATSGEYLGTSQTALRAMLSGPSITTGLANVPQADIAFHDTAGSPVTFTVEDDYRFYFFEYGGNDSAVFTLLDSSMQPITGYSLTIAATDYGISLPKVDASSPDAILYNNGSQGSGTGSGVTFDLDDFGYTGTTPVGGLRYTWVGSQTDPMTFGAYSVRTVPEPGTLVLVTTVAGFVLVWNARRRRRQPPESLLGL